MWAACPSIWRSAYRGRLSESEDRGDGFPESQIPVYGERWSAAIRKTKNGLKQLVIPGMLFENMGITYLGPVDGHNIGQLMRALEEAKRVEGAVILHVCHEEGKGLCSGRAPSCPVPRRRSF